jgi:Asp/Glu/hydantoin racemase
MRLLIVNPNTSDGVTSRIAAAATAVARPEDQFTTVSAASGPPLIVTEADAAEAEAGVLEAVARHEGDVDGIVLASFGDTGAEALRSLHEGLPVLGIAEAAFEAARRIGGAFSIVSFAPEVADSFRRMAERHCMSDRLHRIATLPEPLAHDPADIADALFAPLRDLCLSCAAEGVNCLILGGGPLAGLADRIGPDCPIPVIDGTQAAIDQLRRRLAE